MMNEIIIDENSRLELYSDSDSIQICYRCIDNNSYSDFNLIKTDDFHFIAYTDDDLVNELIFNIDENDILYIPFYKFLQNDNSIKITSDYVRDEFDNDYYVEILKEKDRIVLKFINNMKEKNSINIFNYIIINVAYDLRSKLDQKDTDYKKRLNVLFNDILLELEQNKTKQKKIDR